MEALIALFLGNVVQTTALVTELRQVVGLVAAALAAMIAARLGWHGTDRVIAWRERTDED
ncbi:hypothetical protein [Spirillospora sp. CA-294931]|uniref:hypothetical protein n=1 Tax=Spirillospora sp. CA-294931 TaxID=3240042 RepID=UPI003D8F72BA